MFDLTHKVILVSGGGRGIGAAISARLARAGATVIINVKTNTTEAKGIEKRIIEEGGSVALYQADITHEEEVKRMIETVIADHGTLSGIIHSATAPLKRLSFMDHTWSDIEQHLLVQIKGAYHLAKFSLPHFSAKKSGSILFIASEFTIGRAPSNLIGYTAAKYGLIGLMRSLATEAAKDNVRVNALSPGFVDTPLNKDAPRILKDILQKGVPLGRLTTPEDVAAAAHYLMSDDAAFITGLNIPVAGGNVVL